jgi:FkbM family methyltransferase
MSFTGRALNGFLRFSAKHWWTLSQRVDYVESLGIGGRVLQIPVRNGLGEANLRPQSTELIEALRIANKLMGQGVFVDVGANVGQTLLAVIASAVPTTYFGFEPDLDAAAYVAGLIRLNAIPDASVLPLALGDAPLLADLHSHGAGFVGATIETRMTPDAMYKHRQRIMVSTGDEQLALLGRNDVMLIKIDVEGHECSVLRGMRHTMEHTRAPIYCEVLGYDHFLDGSYGRDYFGQLSASEIRALSEARAENGVAVQTLFAEVGYRMFMADARRQLVPVESIDLASPRPGQHGERNVFAVAEEHVGRVASLLKLAV